MTTVQNACTVDCSRKYFKNLMEKMHRKPPLKFFTSGLCRVSEFIKKVDPYKVLCRVEPFHYIQGSTLLLKETVSRDFRPYLPAYGRINGYDTTLYAAKFRFIRDLFIIFMDSQEEQTVFSGLPKGETNINYFQVVHSEIF
jgi:hypothetical protein